MRRLLLFRLAMLAAALVVAGCELTESPVVKEVPPPQSTLPNITPTLYVPPLFGTAWPWNLNTAMAEELRRHDVAASTEGGNNASYVLYSMAEAIQVDSEAVVVTIYWDLVEPRGELIGTTTQIQRMPITEWRIAPSNVNALAAEAASRVIRIVPDTDFELTDPSLQVVAREEKQKLQERRRLYRKMADRGGLGPLSRRLFLHAEHQERQERIAATRATQARSTSSAPAPWMTSAASDTTQPVSNGMGGAANPAPTPARFQFRQVAANDAADDQEITPWAVPSTSDPGESRTISPTGQDSPTDTADSRWVELGVFREEAEARSFWLRMLETHSDLFAGLQAMFSPANFGELGTYTRVYTGPFATPSDAMGFCLLLQNSRVNCYIDASQQPRTEIAAEPAERPTAPPPEPETVVEVETTEVEEAVSPVVTTAEPGPVAEVAAEEVEGSWNPFASMVDPEAAAQSRAIDTGSVGDPLAGSSASGSPLVTKGVDLENLGDPSSPPLETGTVAKPEAGSAVDPNNPFAPPPSVAPAPTTAPVAEAEAKAVGHPKNPFAPPPGAVPASQPETRTVSGLESPLSTPREPATTTVKGVRNPFAPPPGVAPAAPPGARTFGYPKNPFAPPPELQPAIEPAANDVVGLGNPDAPQPDPQAAFESAANDDEGPVNPDAPQPEYVTGDVFTDVATSPQPSDTTPGVGPLRVLSPPPPVR